MFSRSSTAPVAACAVSFPLSRSLSCVLACALSCVLSCVLCCALPYALTPSLAAAEWRPATGPLKTRWAGQVRPETVLAEYPRPQMERGDWLNLNGLWQLERDVAADAAPPFGRDLPETILVPFPIESALSGVMERTERAWYRRTFHVPGDWAGKRVILHFGAVDWEATVHVNGRSVGSHRGGYDAFSFDVTDALRHSGPQEIVVGVFDPTDRGDQPRGKQVRAPGGIFYTPATGIWQTVWLEPVSAASIAELVIVPDVDGKRLRLTVLGTEAAKDHDVVVAASDPGDPGDPGGKGGGGGRVVATAMGRVGTEISLAIAEPRLWSPDSPYLYDLLVSIGKDGIASDIVQSYFGMRKIEVASDGKVQRLILNGKPLFHIGPLDQGFWPDGIYTAPTDEALRYDIEVTKELGFNAARKHVKVEPARWYWWADRLGLLVWQDMPSANNRTPESRAQFERELERMVLTHRNHPSIVMWVVFNEGWGQYDTERLTAWVKELDPSRLVNNASGWTDMRVGDVIDAHAYPGPGSPRPEASRAAVLGEFGGLGLKVDGHTWQRETWGYQGMADRAHLTRRYLQLLQRVWRLAEDPGLCAAIYTQTTDVETECNGLLTYDRAVVKPEIEKVAAANRGDVPRVRVTEVVATSRKEGKEGVEWRYALEAPAEGWEKPGFDDSAWKVGIGGFGTRGTPGAVVRTEWRTAEIWLRRAFDLAEVPEADLWLQAHHDEDVEVYLNGVLAAKAGGYTTDYEEIPMTAEGKAALKPGRNVMAVRCRQTGGGQYIDVGIVSVVEERPLGAEKPASGVQEPAPLAGEPAPAVEDPSLRHADVFVSGTEGYHTFRIPGIEVAPGGTVLAFAEARKHSAADPGFGKQDIDLVLRRSPDGGRTWTPMQVIEDPGELWSAANPATVVDRKTGRVWLLYLRCRPERSTETARPGTDDNQTIARWSEDAGKTWSEPIDLTAVARGMSDPRWRSSVVGPGGAIQDRKGRLVAPVWKVEPPGVFAIFSEDHGKTWERGALVPGDQGGDEDQIVELPDGTLVIDYRQRAGDHRWLATSADGGRTWSEPSPGLKVTPVCCAIERYPLSGGGEAVIWTGPAGPGRSRLVLRVSRAFRVGGDPAETFPVEREIYPGHAAYSDLAVLEDGDAAVLWERGEKRGYETIAFTRLPRRFVEAE